MSHAQRANANTRPSCLHLLVVLSKHLSHVRSMTLSACVSSRSKLRTDAKVRDVYKIGRTLGTGGTARCRHTMHNEIAHACSAPHHILAMTLHARVQLELARHHGT